MQHCGLSESRTSVSTSDYRINFSTDKGDRDNISFKCIRPYYFSNKKIKIGNKFTVTLLTVTPKAFFTHKT